MAKLELELEEHKAQFRMKKLADQLDRQIPYAFENLSRGVYDASAESTAHAHMGLWGLGHIQAALDRFKAALAERDIEIDSYPGVGDLYEGLSYPIVQLRAFLEAKEAKAALPLDTQMAEILVQHLHAKVKELEIMAGEIDAEYDS